MEKDFPEELEVTILDMTRGNFIAMHAYSSMWSIHFDCTVTHGSYVCGVFYFDFSFKLFRMLRLMFEQLFAKNIS